MEHWRRRLAPLAPEPGLLQDIFQMHRRLRFDQQGLSPDERRALHEAVVKWLARFEQK